MSAISRELDGKCAPQCIPLSVSVNNQSINDLLPFKSIAEF